MNNNLKVSRNLTMLTDFYELTMAAGYFENNNQDKIGIFDMFFRRTPDNAGFAIFAGLESLIDFLDNISFDDEDIEYLKDTKLFSKEFLDYLKNFKFSCDVFSVEEGTPIFEREPILTVRGPMIEAQFIETMLLTILNHQSLIATKANRIVRAAKKRPIMEFGARRAQGGDAAIYGSRAAYIGGCTSTSCTVAAKEFGIPISGTMAHSWIQNFDNEYEAFKRFAQIYSDNCILLVDTYNVLKSGIKNAIKVFDDVLKPKGIRPKGIRIDSGDIAYLSKRARYMLNEAGYSDVKIIASNALDENIIRDLIEQKAEVDIFAVGENLITSKSSPVFSGVYKLAAIEENKKITPKIKLSENKEKTNIPYYKTLYRFYSNETDRAVADLIALKDEEIEYKNGITIFDPIESWKKKNLDNVYIKELPKQIFKGGKLVYKRKNIKDIRDYCLNSVDNLWDEVKRFENPHKYYVDLSFNLWDKNNRLLANYENYNK